MSTPGRASLWLPVVACLTLGLAPYVPLPHFFEKLLWIAAGRTLRAIDVFDLVMHGAPWVWLAAALVAHLRRRTAPPPP